MKEEGGQEEEKRRKKTVGTAIGRYIHIKTATKQNNVVTELDTDLGQSNLQQKADKYLSCSPNQHELVCMQECVCAKLLQL